MSGWNSRNRLRPGSKHLCGQTCLHKLVDEFMANAIAVRTHGTVPEAAEVQERVSRAQVFVRGVEELAVGVDTSLTSNAAYVEVESSARLITPLAPAATPLPAVAAASRPQPGLVAMPAKPHAETFVPQQDEPRYTSRNWHAEAWERERERELRAVEHRPDITARRRSSA